MKPARNWTAKVPDVIAPEARILELETFLPYRLAVLASLTTHALTVVCASHGLTQTEWVILTAIAERPQTSAKAIGATFHMQKAKMSRSVSALLRQGLISAAPRRATGALSNSRSRRGVRRCTADVRPLRRSFRGSSRMHSRLPTAMRWCAGLRRSSGRR